MTKWIVMQIYIHSLAFFGIAFRQNFFKKSLSRVRDAEGCTVFNLVSALDQVPGEPSRARLLSLH